MLRRSSHEIAGRFLITGAQGHGRIWCGRHILFESTTVVTAARLSSPYRLEIMGYEVANLEEAIGKAKNAGVAVLVPSYQSEDRRAAMVQFPGGYIAEIHSIISKPN